MIRAGDIMSEHVVVVYDDMLVKQMAHLMLRDRVSGFPVVSKDMGVVGVVTITDLLKIIQKEYEGFDSLKEFSRKMDEIKDLKAIEIMSKEIISISSDTTLNEIIKIMIEKNIHVFPVIEDRKILGIVGRHDILNAVFSLG